MMPINKDYTFHYTKTKIETEMIITPAEYAEFQHLRLLYKLESKLESVRQLRNLEQDIDAPIRSVVAMLALLGCEPIWSCCGFDYAEQPYHKSHQYGKSYIAMNDNEAIRVLTPVILEAMPFQDKYTIWTIKPRQVYEDDGWVLFADLEGGNVWPETDSIHYSEPGTIAIGYLKKILFGLKDRFTDSVTLGDYNGIHKNRYPDWQYPPLRDWVINKADVLAMAEKELYG
jgi:hypothetical protein